MKSLRFPLLIGGGLIAAGLLYYYTGSKKLNKEQTQGAIGQREVYREGESAAAGTNVKPGTAPVAMGEILKSTAFKQLSKDPQFRNLLSSSEFQQLSQNNAFLNLLQSDTFMTLAKGTDFGVLVSSASFQNELRTNGLATSDLKTTGLAHKFDLKQTSELMKAADLKSLDAALVTEMLNNADFQLLAKSGSLLPTLLKSDSFASMSQNLDFQALVKDRSFESALQQGMASELSSNLAHR